VVRDAGHVAHHHITEPHDARRPSTCRTLPLRKSYQRRRTISSSLRVIEVRVFISYPSEHRKAATDVASALRAEGVDIFLDQDDLPPGEAFHDKIFQAIEDCDLIVFLLTPESIANGRYTRTELKLAEEKWPSASGHVLPVMLQPTDVSQLPSYLGTVTVMTPAGNLAAEVVAEVRKLAAPRWKRALKKYGLPVAAITTLALAPAAWQGVEAWRACEASMAMVGEATSSADAGDYEKAWKVMGAAARACPKGRAVQEAEEDFAIRWVQSIRLSRLAPPDPKMYAGLIDKVEPALRRAASSRVPARAADALAHLGWATYLAAWAGVDGDPTRYYRQAIERDAGNPFAHSYLGFYLSLKRAPLSEVVSHFDAALQVDRARPLVRHTALVALLNHYRPGEQQDAGENAAFKTLNDMRRRGELLPAHFPEALWSRYVDRMVRSRDDGFLGLLPIDDHRQTIDWLFRAASSSKSGNQLADMQVEHLLVRGTLEEMAGNLGEAGRLYRLAHDQLRARLSGTRYGYSPLERPLEQALKRLEAKQATSLK
jgi:TIR domain